MHINALKLNQAQSQYCRVRADEEPVKVYPDLVKRPVPTMYWINWVTIILLLNFHYQWAHSRDGGGDRPFPDAATCVV